MFIIFHVPLIEESIKQSTSTLPWKLKLHIDLNAPNKVQLKKTIQLHFEGFNHVFVGTFTEQVIWVLNVFIYYLSFNSRIFFS